ncbi:MAG: zinc dependent phospholipase C family protein [Erysipelotrichaceae bacterium]|nr:zinc dependent phospholipase C family protein [Erysipelotrichaceae bacterium]
MPTTYAHWRFGDKCIPTLPKELQEIIKNNRKIFNFGVHGPDIFFYYNCLKHNDVNQYGTNLHDTPFNETLKNIKPCFKKCDDQEAALAYLLGFVCHFTLDSYCHGYIDRKAEVSKETDKPTTHGIIEAQFDKYLLKKDGYNPFRKNVTFSLKPNKQIGHIIGQLFPDLGEEIAYKSIKDQKFYLTLLHDSNSVKRSLLEKAMDMAHAPAFKDLLLTEKEFPEIEDSIMRLDKLFDKAVEHYPILAQDLVSYLINSVPLEAYYKHHFCPKKDYQKIPILSADAERNYVVELQD